ncbi:peptidase S28 [Lentinus brumalis]|uniref:Peptidase S28 n=1 Tax=Lentinus brumalis TaxID=2498619 RepID=A0A371CSI0_9APHY|nr:peptidase S28 [Polyporus brumalis]
MLLLSAISLLAILSVARALPPPRPGTPAFVRPRPSIPHLEAPSEELPVVSRNGTQLPAYTKTYYFNQLIDHNNPSLGTFRQQYWHTYEFYEPGGPIILSTPGEVDASGYTSYLTNSTLNGRIAQQLNGSTIVLEHRFFGNSNPYPDLSVQSFRVHTVQQAISDLAYFAQNVQLPMPGGDKVAPGKAPWILIGGSYAGALTSYAMKKHNSKSDVFYAGYASSAVVQATVDFWGYFEPIRQSMPANCSADVQAVIAHVDSVLASNDSSQINTLKSTFGLQGLSHNDDFAAALQQNFFTWQNLQLDSGPNGDFFKFCDALEVKNGVSAPASGWGLDYALQAWGSFWKNTFYEQICGSDDNDLCLGTYDSTNPYWSYTYAPNAGRSWQWLTCNEFGFNFDGAPASQPTIASRFVKAVWSERQCGYHFPGAFGSNSVVASPNAVGLNNLYQGWNTTAQRLIFANGIRDPWREATVAADGTTNAGSDMQPHLLSDGFHCSDLLVREGAASAKVKSVQDSAVSYMAKWIAEWKPTA